jgi:hypothetical protein
MCNICKLKNVKLQDAVEHCLQANGGTLSRQDRRELATTFNYISGVEEKLDAITAEDCDMHWHFHQAISYLTTDENENGNATDAETERSTLARDVGKGEAEVLFDLMNKQAATFNCLTNKINKTLLDEEVDISHAMIHPNVATFYKDLGDSIRSTINAIRELNITVNGEKNGALEGLKALANALGPQNTTSDMTTNKFDY